MEKFDSPVIHLNVTENNKPLGISVIGQFIRKFRGPALSALLIAGASGVDNIAFAEPPSIYEQALAAVSNGEKDKAIVMFKEILDDRKLDDDSNEKAVALGALMEISKAEDYEPYLNQIVSKDTRHWYEFAKTVQPKRRAQFFRAVLRTDLSQATLLDELIELEKDLGNIEESEKLNILKEAVSGIKLSLAKDDYKEASSYASALTTAHPAPSTHLLAANLYADTGYKSNEAKKEYEELLKFEPNNHHALVGMARTYSQNGDAEKAVEFYQKALEVNPNQSVVCSDMGTLAAKKGEHVQAIQYFAKAVELDENNFLAHYSWGLSLMSIEQRNSADKEFAKAAKINPDLEELNEYWARILHHLGRYSESIELYKKTAEYGFLIMATVDSGDLKSAKVLFEKHKDAMSNIQKANAELSIFSAEGDSRAASKKLSEIEALILGANSDGYNSMSELEVIQTPDFDIDYGPNGHYSGLFNSKELLGVN